jgi:curved DNA-binding protein CbpA
MNDDALKVIWSDNAQTDSSFTATYEEFKSAMNQSQDFRNAVYDGIRERDNKATATNQEWDKYLGFNSITNTNAVVETEKPTVTTQKSTLRNEAYSTLSDDDLQGKYNDMLKKAEQRKKEAIEKAKNEQIALAKEKPLLHAISQIGQSTAKSPDLAKTPIELMEQQDVSWFLDENDKNEYNLLRNEIGVRGYESGYEGIKKSTEEEENRVKNIRSNAELNGTKLTARDKSMLRKAEEINRDARELVEAGSKFGNESGIENWADALGNTLIDRDMVIGVGLIRDMKVDNMVEKVIYLFSLHNSHA